MAFELGCDWHTVNEAVTTYGQEHKVIEVLDRLEAAADFWARGTPPCWVCGNFQ